MSKEIRLRFFHCLEYVNCYPAEPSLDLYISYFLCPVKLLGPSKISYAMRLLLLLD